MQTQFVQRVNRSFANSPDVIRQTMQNTKIPASKNVYCIILLQFCTLGRSKNSKAVKENARFSSK